MTDTKRKTENLKKMYELVNIAEDILENENKNLDEFGKLLDYSWNLKKQTGDAVTNSSIDEIYNMGIKAGALGGKILGAGGGGFIAFYVPKGKQKKVRETLSGLQYTPFKFENNGTKIIHNTPEDMDYMDD